MEAIASRMEAAASRMEAIASIRIVRQFLQYLDRPFPFRTLVV